jgi:hypothetical protein
MYGLSPLIRYSTDGICAGKAEKRREWETSIDI